MTLLGILAAALLQADPPAGDWPRFRGPTGDGVASKEADPPLDWSETKNVAWKTPLPGRGRSSPVLSGGRIFLTTALERGVERKRIGPDDMQTAEHVALGALCLDAADGKILWQSPLLQVDRPEPVHWLSSWATPTPVAADGRVYFDFGTYGTWCLDPVTGKTLWAKRLPLDHQVGPGSSPAVVGDRLILVRDGRDVQCVTALHAKTGEVAWETARPPIQAGSGNAKKSFSSPLEIRVGDRLQVVAAGPHWVASYDPASGRELWRLRHGTGWSIGTVPVFGHGTVYAGTGCMKPNLVAIRADGEGDVTSTHLAWRSQTGVPVMSSPVLAGDLLFWVSDGGIVTCADARSGDVRWQERLKGDHLASPILAAGRLYFFGKDGKAAVLKAGPAAERLGEGRVEGLVTATPAAVGKALYVRTDTHLYRIEAR
jgi:hypothetical protein